MIKEAIVALVALLIILCEVTLLIILCEENGLIFKGGANFQDNKGIGCKACYCEKQIPLECGD